MDPPQYVNKARVKTSHQALAVILNTGLDNGAPLLGGLTLVDIATILGGTDIDAINDLHNILDNYNNSYDGTEIEDLDGYPIEPADPKAAKLEADISIADS